MTESPSLPATTNRTKANQRLVLILASVPIFMVLAAFFIMRPLYTLWCASQGGGTSPNNVAIANQIPQNTGRFVHLYWTSQVFDQLPVIFRAEKETESLEIGIEGSNTYHIKNLSDRVVQLRPIHQVSPIQATAKFGMRVCFCFREQTLQPHEEKDFEISYTFDPTLDERVRDVTLKYSLFEVKADGPSAEQLAIEQATKVAIAAADPAEDTPANASSLTGAADSSSTRPNPSPNLAGSATSAPGTQP